MPLVTEEERNLSKDEQLKLIDQEIQDLYEQCIKLKFSPSEILECAKPVLDPIYEYESRRRFKRFVVISSILAVVFALFWYKPTSDFLHALLRIFIITVVPLDKLTEYYQTECLISNPYYEQWKFTETGCNVCENITQIERLSNVDPTVFADTYMLRNRPVIITDAMDKWPSHEKFSIQFLSDIYHTHSELNQTDPCNIFSNINLKPGQHRKLLKGAAKGKVDDFFVFWDNCNIKMTKVYREFCPRPYFLPRMVEQSTHTFVIVAKTIKTDKYRLFIGNTQMTWFAQIRGETKIKVEPLQECMETCKSLEFTLKEGEILAVVADMYDVFYMPTAETESILVGGAAFFDM